MRKGAQTGMAPAFEKSLSPAARRPQRTPDQTDAPQLQISVVFTSVAPTLRALQEAAALASRLAARITLIVPQVVPFPLPLESPPVLLDFNERRFFTIATASRIETTVRIYLCRDQWDLLAELLRPRSLIVVGGRKRWWPTTERRLVRRLRRMGHEVIAVETE
jgi:hypothetical protein